MMGSRWLFMKPYSRARPRSPLQLKFTVDLQPLTIWASRGGLCSLCSISSGSYPGPECAKKHVSEYCAIFCLSRPCQLMPFSAPFCRFFLASFTGYFLRIPNWACPQDHEQSKCESRQLARCWRSQKYVSLLLCPSRMLSPACVP